MTGAYALQRHEALILGGLGTLWALGIVAAVGQKDLMVLGLLVGLPATAIAVAFMLRVLSGNRLASLALFTFSLIMLTAVFRVRDYDDKSIDFQILLKLGSWALLVGVMLARIRTHFAIYLTGSAGRWMMLYAWMAVTASWSPAPVPNTVAVISLMIFHMFSVYMVSFNSERSVILCVVYSALFLSLASIAVYYANPNLGRMLEWINGAHIPGDRMRGITGSPNSIGGVAALGIMMVSLYWREFGRRTRYICAFSVLVFLAAIVLSQSRSPIAAVMVILLCNAFFRPGRGALAIAGGILGIASFIAIFPFIDSILGLLSRSGSAEEILTFTGRSEIWAVVIDLWTQKPIHGWGYGAMLYILPTYPGLFEAAAHAHNLYLEVLVGGGLIGFMLLMLAICSSLFWGFRVGDRRALALIFFILLRGITEAAPFSGVAGFTYLALTLGVALISHKQTVQRHARLGFSVTPPASVPARLPPA